MSHIYWAMFWHFPTQFGLVGAQTHSKSPFHSPNMISTHIWYSDANGRDGDPPYILEGNTKQTNLISSIRFMMILAT
jgi:hypothetical protein